RETDILSEQILVEIVDIFSWWQGQARFEGVGHVGADAAGDPKIPRLVRPHSNMAGKSWIAPIGFSWLPGVRSGRNRSVLDFERVIESVDRTEHSRARCVIRAPN